MRLPFDQKQLGDAARRAYLLFARYATLPPREPTTIALGRLRHPPPSTGMALAGAARAGRREAVRSVASAGAMQAGVGIIPARARRLAAIILANAATGVLLWAAIVSPYALAWVCTFALIAAASRPTIRSFRQWFAERVPDVVRRRERIIERFRARVAPAALWLRPPDFQDYGLFAVVTARDFEGFVYVYLGCFGRWCLLGWYHSEDGLASVHREPDSQRAARE